MPPPETPRFVPKPAVYVRNLIRRVNWAQIEHPALDFLELGVAVRLVEPSECRFDIGRLATILELLMQALRQASTYECSTPIARRKRVFSKTPSRGGNTRGGSLARIATRANNVVAAW